jgi:hypothetical protein
MLIANGLTRYIWEFTIYDLRDKSGFAQRATPDGSVFVQRGYAERIEDEGERESSCIFVEKA